MTERELLRTATRLCSRYGVYWWHVDDPTRGRRGLPDLLLIGTEAMCFRELKTSSGKLTPEQREIGDRMGRAGIDWQVWRPEDVATGRVDRQIAQLSGRQPWSALAG